MKCKDRPFENQMGTTKIKCPNCGRCYLVAGDNEKPKICRFCERKLTNDNPK